jgi:hypothetical protein
LHIALHVFQGGWGKKKKIKMSLWAQRLKGLEPRTSWSPAQRSAANQATESHNSEVAMEQWEKKWFLIETVGLLLRSP